MSFIDNEAEMMAEHEEAKARAEAERKAAKEKVDEEQNAKWREAQRIAHEKRVAELTPYYKAIASALSDFGNMKAEVVEGDELQITVMCEGYVYKNLSYFISFDTMYANSGNYYRDRKPVGLRCCVGLYGERRSFPQKKDGTFSYHKIADALAPYVHKAVNKAKAKATKASVADVVEVFCKKYGIEKYYANGAMMAEASSVGAEKPLQVSIEIKRAMSVAEAEKLAEVLTELGFMKKVGLTVVK